MKNLLILLAFVTCLFITPSFYAQGDYEWINKGEGRLDNEGLYTDAKGNTYITGTFAGNVKLDSISLSTGNINKHEIYVAKYSTTGKIIWAKKFNAANLGTEAGYSVYADTTGNCYVVGTISVQTVFGAVTLNPTGYEDAFIVKLDPSGTVLWAKLGTGPYQIEAFAVTCDKLNNVYVTGRFRFTATFGSFSITAKGTNADIFLVKYDAAGNVLWIKQAGTENGQDIGYGTITDSQNNVYITGHFEGSGTFDTLSVNAGVYIAKYDLNGKLIWVRSGGSNISCNFYSIGVDAADNIYTAGNIADGKIIFGNDTLTAAKSDMMVCKFKSDGNKIWLRKFEGSNEEYATTLRVDPAGNAYIGGYSYSKEIDFGPYHFTSYGDADAFVTKVNDAGDIVWVKQIGGKSQDGGPAGLFHPANIGIDATGKVYFKTSISSDPVYVGINKADSVINNGSTLLFKTGMSLSVKKRIIFVLLVKMEALI